MLTIVLVYLVAPFVLAASVVKFLRRHAPDTVPPEVRRCVAEDPVPAKGYRALRREGPRVAKLGDFETQDEALETAFCARAAAAADAADYLVIDAKGDILRQL